jgi:diaminopimelate epimerase
MMEDMRFAKGHGTGNDFVILPDPDDRLALTPELVAGLCDRRRGIGGDGLLRVVRRDGEWFMDYWNADGSLAEMCGNGARVYARYLVSAGFAEPGRIRIKTRAGGAVAVIDGDSVTVDMGLPRVYGASSAIVDARGYPGTAVDCGNPHLVCPVNAVSTLDALDLTRPPAVDPGFFPDGVNVEFFVPVVDLHVRMRVHERGVGETLSCGTGACAVAAVALAQLGRSTGTVTVDVPGGRLKATFDGVTCWLAGPAVIVAEGETAVGR